MISSLGILILGSSMDLDIRHQHYTARHMLNDVRCIFPTFK